jgi:hypothetical protein
MGLMRGLAAVRPLRIARALRTGLLAAAGPGIEVFIAMPKGAERPATRERPESVGVTTFEFG